MDRLDGVAEFKFADADATARGEFIGYASTFGNVDLGGDIVDRGAFTKTLATKKLKDIKMFFGHDARSVPIGKWLELREDDRGLMARGQLTLDIPRARDVHAAMKDGTLDAMSIGYRVPQGGSVLERNGLVRRLKEINLFEISVVPIGMNPRAGISRVKALEWLDGPLCRAIEQELRKELNLSNAAAVSAVAILKKHLREGGDLDCADASREADGLAETAASLRRNISTLTRW